MLGHKTIFNIFEIIEIIQNMFCTQNGMKLEINYIRKFGEVITHGS